MDCKKSCTYFDECMILLNIPPLVKMNIEKLEMSKNFCNSEFIIYENLKKLNLKKSKITSNCDTENI